MRSQLCMYPLKLTYQYIKYTITMCVCTVWLGFYVCVCERERGVVVVGGGGMMSVLVGVLCMSV